MQNHTDTPTIESWFYLITVEIEQKGAATIVPLLLTMDAIIRSREAFKCSSNDSSTEDEVVENDKITADRRSDGKLENVVCGGLFELSEENLMVPLVTRYVISQLEKVSLAIREMLSSLNSMREGCLPFIFYHRLVVFML